MTALRLGLAELRRVTSGRVSRVAVGTLLVVPAVYGGLALYANDDPYANLRNVPAAIVVEDAGARDSEGRGVEAGQDVADELLAGESFAWEQTSAAEAAAGVRDGSFDFSLTVPRDFSAALTSSATFDPAQAQLRLTTNEAGSYVSASVSGEVTRQVREALAVRLGTEAADNFLLGISDTRGGLLAATQGATTLLDGVERAAAAGDQVSGGADELATGALTLRDGIRDGLEALDAVPERLDELAALATDAGEDGAAVSAAGSRIAELAAESSQEVIALGARLRNTLQQQGLSDGQVAAVMDVYAATRDDVRATNDRAREAARGLDDVSGLQRVADGSAKVAEELPALLEELTASGEAAAGLGRSADALASGTGQLLRTLGQVTDTGTSLRDNLQAGADRIPTLDGKSRDTLARTIGNPVAVTSIAPTRATSYGDGLAPLLLALAAWAGAYLLFLVLRPLSTRAIAANQNPLRIALSGWLPAALLGAAQMTVLAGAVVLAVGTAPEHVPGTLGFLLLVSASFVAIVHMLTAWFGRAGQLVALGLLVVQVLLAGGPFPWQTIPVELHGLHDALPLSYAVSGLRQLLYGGPSDSVWTAVAVLAGFLVVSLLLTAAAARRRGVWSVQRLRPELAV